MHGAALADSLDEALRPSGRTWTIAATFSVDKFNFETVKTGKSALKCAEMVHTWFGAKFEQKKNLLPSTSDVLGVTYNLEKRFSRPRMIAGTCSLR